MTFEGFLLFTIIYRNRPARLSLRNLAWLSSIYKHCTRICTRKRPILTLSGVFYAHFSPDFILFCTRPGKMYTTRGSMPFSWSLKIRWRMIEESLKIRWKIDKDWKNVHLFLTLFDLGKSKHPLLLTGFDRFCLFFDRFLTQGIKFLSKVEVKMNDSLSKLDGFWHLKESCCKFLPTFRLKTKHLQR